jgi:hypothetical protein
MQLPDFRRFRWYPPHPYFAYLLLKKLKKCIGGYLQNLRKYFYPLYFHGYNEQCRNSQHLTAATPCNKVSICPSPVLLNMALSNAKQRANERDCRARTPLPSIALCVVTMERTVRILACQVHNTQTISMGTQPKKPVLSSVLHQTSSGISRPLGSK